MGIKSYLDGTGDQAVESSFRRQALVANIQSATAEIRYTAESWSDDELRWIARASGKLSTWAYGRLAERERENTVSQTRQI